MSEVDPLDEIFVNSNEPADKKILAEIIKPFATIDQKGIIAYTDKYEKLAESKKGLVYMLCKKAMVMKGLSDVTEQTGVKEMVNGARISESNAKKSLFTYYKNIVRKGLIPSHCVKKAKELIFEKDKK